MAEPRGPAKPGMGALHDPPTRCVSLLNMGTFQRIAPHRVALVGLMFPSMTQAHQFGIILDDKEVLKVSLSTQTSLSTSKRIGISQFCLVECLINLTRLP